MEDIPSRSHLGNRLPGNRFVVSSGSLRLGYGLVAAAATAASAAIAAEQTVAAAAEAGEQQDPDDPFTAVAAEHSAAASAVIAASAAPTSVVAVAAEEKQDDPNPAAASAAIVLGAYAPAGIVRAATVRSSQVAHVFFLQGIIYALFYAQGHVNVSGEGYIFPNRIQ